MGGPQLGHLCRFRNDHLTRYTQGRKSPPGLQQRALATTADRHPRRPRSKTYPRRRLLQLLLPPSFDANFQLILNIEPKIKLGVIEQKILRLKI